MAESDLTNAELQRRKPIPSPDPLSNTDSRLHSATVITADPGLVSKLDCRHSHGLEEKEAGLWQY
jgi:hypothetical protein